MLKVSAYAIVEKDGDKLSILQTPRTNKFCIYTSRGRAEAQLKSTSYMRVDGKYVEMNDYPGNAFVIELKGEINE